MTVVPHDKLADPSSPVSREADSPATLVAMLRDRDYPKRPPRNARVLFLCTVFALGFLINSLLGTSVLLLSPAHTAATLPQAQYNGAGGGGGGRADDERRQTESLFLLPQATHPAVNSSNGPKWNYTAASSKSFTDRCFYVEDICRSSHRWFYRPPKSKSTTTTTTTTTTNPNGAATTKRQPDVLLMKEFEAFRVNSAANNPSYRQSYRFERNASVLTPSQWDECVDSPIENHLVLFSVYNEMLGEFYDKSLVFLWLLSREHAWVKSAQLYLHMYMPFRRLLDSHHLFTSPFRSNPLLDFTALLDEPTCTCLPRLVLCGYRAIPQKEAAEPSETTNTDETTSDPPVSHAPPDRIVLEPGASLWRHTDNVYPTPHSMFRDFRTHMRQSLIESNPHVQRDIRNHRDGILARRHIPVSERDEWKVVGLAQRSSRRRWRDLTTVGPEAQEALLSHKVLLVEVNVETRASTSYQQVVWHGALDGLVGIHGAQLTEAIWMKPGSWLLELLPYVPKGLYMGQWVTFTDKPTPLGDYFYKTDLNHASYPLTRDSAPYCHDDNVEDHPEDPLLCWRQKHNPWDNRDFVLDAPTLVDILNRTVLVESPQSLCRDYVDRAGDRVIVLGNVNCAETPRAPVAPHHYHWINETDAPDAGHDPEASTVR